MMTTPTLSETIVIILVGRQVSHTFHWMGTREDKIGFNQAQECSSLVQTLLVYLEAK